jgi:hypothetical protein
MKHKTRKFEMGGPTSYAESGSAGGSEMSFSEAFKAARAVAKREGRDPDKELFTWKGEKYRANLEKEKKPKEEEKTAARKVSPEEFTANMNARLGAEDKILPDSFMPRQTKYPKLEPRSKAAKTDKDIAKEMYSGISKYRGSDSVYENLAKGRKPGYKKGGMPDLTGDGKVTRADVLKGRGVFNGGGSVKKMAGGGMARSSASKRADGIASKGKTRGRII